MNRFRINPTFTMIDHPKGNMQGQQDSSHCLCIRTQPEGPARNKRMIETVGRLLFMTGRSKKTIRPGHFYLLVEM